MATREVHERRRRSAVARAARLTRRRRILHERDTTRLKPTLYQRRAHSGVGVGIAGAAAGVDVPPPAPAPTPITVSVRDAHVVADDRDTTTSNSSSIIGTLGTRRRVLERWRITTDVLDWADRYLVRPPYRIEGEPSWLPCDYEAGDRFRSTAIVCYSLRDGRTLRGNQPPDDHDTVDAVHTLSGSLYYLGQTRARPVPIMREATVHPQADYDRVAAFLAD